MQEILKVNNDDIISIFEYEGKEYCAFVDSEQENDDNIYFALVTKIDEKTKILTSVLEKDIDNVIKAYEQQDTLFNIINEELLEKDDLNV